MLVARHPNRPGLEDFIERLFTGFIEIHGDRRFADDHALMTGFAEYHGQPVLVVGHVKGGDTKEKIFRKRYVSSRSSAARRPITVAKTATVGKFIHSGRIFAVMSSMGSSTMDAINDQCTVIGVAETP